MIAVGTRTKIGIETIGIEEGRVSIIEMTGIGEIVSMIGVDDAVIGNVEGKTTDEIEDPEIGMDGIETDGEKEAAEDIGKVTQEATQARWATAVEVVVGTVLPTINTTDTRRVRITATTATHLQCQPTVTVDQVRGHLLHHRRRNPNRLLLPRAEKLDKVKLLWTTATCGMTENPASHLHRNLPQLHPLQAVTIRMNWPWPAAMTKTADPHLIWTRE